MEEEVKESEINLKEEGIELEEWMIDTDIEKNEITQAFLNEMTRIREKDKGNVD